VEAQLQSGLHGLQNPFHPAPPGDAGEDLGSDGVQGDVDPVEARLHQLPGPFGEEEAVGGDGHVLYALLFPGLGDHLGKLLAHQGLAPREAHGGEAQEGGGLQEVVHFLHGEGTRGLGHLEAQGVAVEAVKVAAGRHRDANVLDDPPIGVQ
jgi:hypothetical protein